MTFEWFSSFGQPTKGKEERKEEKIKEERKEGRVEERKTKNVTQQAYRGNQMAHIHKVCLSLNISRKDEHELARP